jgi:hypothetical protein
MSILINCCSARLQYRTRHERALPKIFTWWCPAAAKCDRIRTSYRVSRSSGKPQEQLRLLRVRRLFRCGHKPSSRLLEMADSARTRYLNPFARPPIRGQSERYRECEQLKKLSPSWSDRTRCGNSLDCDFQNSKIATFSLSAIHLMKKLFVAILLLAALSPFCVQSEQSSGSAIICLFRSPLTTGEVP